MVKTSEHLPYFVFFGTSKTFFIIFNCGMKKSSSMLFNNGTLNTNTLTVSTKILDIHMHVSTANSVDPDLCLHSLSGPLCLVNIEKKQSPYIKSSTKYISKWRKCIILFVVLHS